MSLEKGGVERKKGVGSIYTSDKLVFDDPIKENLPGLNSSKINPEIEIEGGGAGSKTIKFSHLASAGTGVFSFGGFGFTPSHYNIVAWRSSDVTGTGTVLDCHSIAGRDILGISGGMSVRPNGANEIEVANTTSVIRCLYSNVLGGGDTRAIHNNFTGDGIKLDFQASAEDIEFRLTCYS